MRHHVGSAENNKEEWRLRGERWENGAKQIVRERREKEGWDYYTPCNMQDKNTTSLYANASKWYYCFFGCLLNIEKTTQCSYHYHFGLTRKWYFSSANHQCQLSIKNYIQTHSMHYFLFFYIKSAAMLLRRRLIRSVTSSSLLAVLLFLNVFTQDRWGWQAVGQRPWLRCTLAEPDLGGERLERLQRSRQLLLLLLLGTETLVLRARETELKHGLFLLMSIKHLDWLKSQSFVLQINKKQQMLAITPQSSTDVFKFN